MPKSPTLLIKIPMPSLGMQANGVRESTNICNMRIKPNTIIKVTKVSAFSALWTDVDIDTNAAASNAGKGACPSFPSWA